MCSHKQQRSIPAPSLCAGKAPLSRLLFLASPPPLLPLGRSPRWEPQAGSAEEDGLCSERYAVPLPGLPGGTYVGLEGVPWRGASPRCSARWERDGQAPACWASRPVAAPPVPVWAAGRSLPASVCLASLGPAVLRSSNKQRSSMMWLIKRRDP